MKGSVGKEKETFAMRSLRALGSYIISTLSHEITWSSTHNPTGPFTALKPRDQEIGELYVVQECRWTDLKAPEL